MRSRQPDILREGGDYDRWYIRDESGTEFRGFDSWMQVEGSLLRFFASLLNDFGMVDLGSPSPGEPFGAFRLCADLDERLAGKSVFASPKENGKIAVASTGQILVSPLPRGSPITSSHVTASGAGRMSAAAATASPPPRLPAHALRG